MSGSASSPSPGLPTPRARDWKSGGKDGLHETVRLLPTPRATDGTKGGPNQRGSSGDLMLPSAVNRLLPTPMAADGGADRGSSAGFGLRNTSREIARRSSGGPTPPPSTAGNESSDAPPQAQLTIWDD